MSPSVATRTWGRAPEHDLRSRRPLLVLLIAGLVLAVLLAPHLALPAKVPPLAIDNGGEYSVTIEASNGAGDGWAPVAVVPAGQTVVVHELIDEGPNWTFRFTSQGHRFDGYGVRRADLAAAGWRYAVPDEVMARLRADGVPPSP
jgi:hypothetical protein